MDERLKKGKNWKIHLLRKEWIKEKDRKKADFIVQMKIFDSGKRKRDTRLFSVRKIKIN